MATFEYAQQGSRSLTPEDAQIYHLPLIDIQMDREEFTCAYSLWAFLKNQ